MSLMEHRRPEDLGGSQGGTDSDGHEKAKVGMILLKNDTVINSWTFYYRCAVH